MLKNIVNMLITKATNLLLKIFGGISINKVEVALVLEPGEVINKDILFSGGYDLPTEELNQSLGYAIKGIRRWVWIIAITKVILFSLIALGVSYFTSTLALGVMGVLGIWQTVETVMGLRVMSSGTRSEYQAMCEAAFLIAR